MNEAQTDLYVPNSFTFSCYKIWSRTIFIYIYVYTHNINQKNSQVFVFCCFLIFLFFSLITELQLKFWDCYNQWSCWSTYLPNLKKKIYVLDWGHWRSWALLSYTRSQYIEVGLMKLLWDKGNLWLCNLLKNIGRCVGKVQLYQREL